MLLHTSVGHISKIESNNFQSRHSYPENRQTGYVFVECDDGTMLVVQHADISLFRVGQKVRIEATADE